jgi:hypothetical protein
MRIFKAETRELREDGEKSPKAGTERSEGDGSASDRARDEGPRSGRTDA